jgi:dTDP-4-amino-4,6-dideoxygalactose transaminase
MIPVTRPFLPPREEYEALLDGIWDRIWLTNNGPLVHQFEEQVAARLELARPLYVASGTLALQLAMKALGLDGDVVTTPFSYVATTSALVWEGCTPVFADIEPGTFTIDPAAVDAAITGRTSGIVATHVFGTPCDIDALDAIGRVRGIPVLYDAAHSFATTYRGCSVLSYGDASACSLHATKVFHTVEGGLLVTRDEVAREAAERMRNFGHVDYTTFDGVGINAKASELHAAMGLCNLGHLDELLARRRAIYERYHEGLADLIEEGRVVPQSGRAEAVPNHSYVPMLFEDAGRRERVHEELEARDIHPRRYFSPALHELNYLGPPPSLPVVEDVAARILCLPTYHDMTDEQVDEIVSVIVAAHRS